MDGLENINTDKMSDIEKAILQLKYANRKLSLRQIGQLLDPPIVKQTVHQYISKPKFKLLWDILEKDVIGQLKSAQFKAVSLLISHLNSNDERLANSTAKFLIGPIIENCPQYLPDMIERLEELEFITTEGDNENT